MSFNIDVFSIAEKRKLEQQAQNITVQAPELEFLSALKHYGFDIDDVKTTDDGETIRVKPVDGRNKDCWYRFGMINSVGYGVYGDWRNGKKELFVSTSYKLLSVEERRTNDALFVIKTENDNRVEKEKHIAAKKTAQMKLASMTEEVVTHPYLEKKGVRAYGLKTDGHNLYIPLCIRDEITSYQSINPDGEKMLLKGGEVSGGYHIIKGKTPHTYFVEGYATGATVHMATKATVFVCFNSGNLIKVLDYYREYIDQPVIIAADNDHQTEAEGKGNAGLKVARACVEKHKNVTMIYPATEKGVTDFNDLASLRGIHSVKELLGQKKNKIEILQVDQMESIPEKWFIKKILPSKKVGLVFGRSGHMKSFVVIDMALHLATGRDWHGHRVNDTHNVLYVCGEGASGIRNRVISWKKHHKITQPVPFYMTSSPVLLLEREQTDLMLEAIEDFMIESNINQYPSIIVIDTLNRNFGDGDENSTKDMTAFVNVLEDLHKKTGSMFLIVHHSSKGNEETARGNASLTNSCDVAFKVEMTNELQVRQGFEKPKIQLTNTKMKDYAVPDPQYFTPKTIVLGKDEDGEDITSVVMEKSVDVVNERTLEMMNKPVIAAKTDTEKSKICFKNAIITIGQSLAKQNGKFSVCAPLPKKMVDTEYKGNCLRSGVSDSSSRQGKVRAIIELSQSNIMTTNDKSNEYTVTNQALLQTINGAIDHD
jgi:phage/plasmid primase-like uncharacterized protein